jgi:uncharacterized protein (TIRG00374 family)
VSIVGRVAMIAALVGLTVLAVSQFTDFRTLLRTLGQGHWGWIAAGVAIHLVYFYCYAWLYRLCFSLVGVQSKAWRLLPILFAGLFVNAVVPTGGAGAAALFVDDAVKRGESGPCATVGVVLVLIADLVTLVPFVIYGMAFLSRRGLLDWYDWVGVGAYVGYLGLLVGMLALARWRERALERLLGALQRLVNRVARRFHRPDFLGEKWAHHLAHEFCMAARALGSRPWRLVLIGGWGVFIHVVNLVGLWAMLEAFAIHVPWGGLIAAFGMGIIFFIIAVIPEGVAVVETVMTLIFHALGIATAAAVTATVVFRFANFWLPVVLGILALRRVRNLGARE